MGIGQQESTYQRLIDMKKICPKRKGGKTCSPVLRNNGRFICVDCGQDVKRGKKRSAFTQTD